MELPCRICSKENSKNISIYIRAKGKYLPHVIYNISGVKITKENEPEAKICRHCIACILVAENIILQCQESAEYLQFERLQNDTNSQQEEGKSSAATEIANDHTEETLITTNTNGEEVPNIVCQRKENSTVCCDEPPIKRQKAGDDDAPPPSALFNCDQCDYSTKTGKHIIEHKQSEHNIYDPNIYACTHCPKRFSWKPTLYRHIELDHKTMPADKHYLCNECGRAYMREIHLKEHVKQRHGPRNFKCPDPLCEQSFTRAFTLRRHFLQTHTEQSTAMSSRYHCKDCDKYFKIYDQWKYHNEVVHRNELVYCPHCGYPFRFKEKLEEHLQKNACERSVVPCSYCQRRFTTKNGLREHIRNIHSIG